MSALRKFSSQAEPEILEGLQEIAAREGRQFQAVLGEAMREYVARRNQQATRRSVIEGFQESLRERDELYRSLAKSTSRRLTRSSFINS
jgi:predicted transcriptional regulator